MSVIEREPYRLPESRICGLKSFTFGIQNLENHYRCSLIYVQLVMTSDSGSSGPWRRATGLWTSRARIATIAVNRVGLEHCSVFSAYRVTA